jgi:hypothetical protein
MMYHDRFPAIGLARSLRQLFRLSVAVGVCIFQCVCIVFWCLYCPWVFVLSWGVCAFLRCMGCPWVSLLSVGVWIVPGVCIMQAPDDNTDTQGQYRHRGTVRTPDGDTDTQGQTRHPWITPRCWCFDSFSMFVLGVLPSWGALPPSLRLTFWGYFPLIPASGGGASLPLFGLLPTFLCSVLP